jgi:hypothetical protein
MTDRYRYWRMERKTPNSQPRDTNEDIAGFWRHDGAKTKPSWPVAVWYDEDGTGHHKVGNSQKDGDDALIEFKGDTTWHKTTAVTQAEYDAAMATGFWADGKNARHMDDAEKMGIDIGAGGNNAPADETLAEQIAALAGKLDTTPEPSTQEQANALSGLLDKMRALLKLAEGERVKEKQPHLDAGRDVDAKWQAIGQPGGDAYREGEARRKAFLRKEQARLDREAAEEGRRQQAIVDAENARIRAENEKAAAEAAEAGQDSPAPPMPEIAAPAVEAPRAVAGSAFGRASGLKKVIVLDALDIEALAFHFIETKDDDFVTYLTERARKAIRAKVKLPGVTTKEELQ